MELKELRQKIKDAPSSELFANQVIQINLPRVSMNRKFIGVSAFYEYLLNQIEGFQSFEGELPEELNTSKKYFLDLKKKIISFIQSYQNVDVNSFSNVWGRDVGNSVLASRSTLIFEFDAPVTSFLLEIYQSKKRNYKGALDYVSDTIVVNELREKNYLNGLILAYEYFQKGETEIEKRRVREKSSLTRLRNQIDKYISDSEKDFIELSKGFESSVKATTDEIIAYKEEKSGLYEEWFESTSANFSEFDTASKKKVIDLETLYREKLKLEAPAKYWNDRAVKLRKEGNRWLISLVIFTLVGIGLFILLLNFLSNGVLEDIFSDTATAIKWSVIFITFVSFLAFLIKTFSKLTFSAFHLVRDAEEREQLTIVFLSMQKEQAIDPTERHLIMQSLFSRADTGLLKDEGSPTMPGNIFDKIVAGNK
ncbi:hypothetical protein SAMN04489724_0077 [Algoriphagus locisalis]|uniref:DUF6161 domain-containing protein n=1 Tax=Algoriphagus locisalis TaxID=305507 RepID=A0A1I7E4Y5_9BACT|nr:DUF6161 domain-containing protein [Algoriphagus locisalis]SFU19008.1 hypothetical protein SAMN04489724_0077 [Algoriphagus locisalis]